MDEAWRWLEREEEKNMRILKLDEQIPEIHFSGNAVYHRELLISHGVLTEGAISSALE